MSCFNINLQQGSSFKRVPFTKETIYFTVKLLVLQKGNKLSKNWCGIYLHIKHLGRCYGILFLFQLFRLDWKVGKDLWMRMALPLLWYFFESAILEVTWPELFLKFVFSNSKANWQQHFKRLLTVEDFTGMDWHLH